MNESEFGAPSGDDSSGEAGGTIAAVAGILILCALGFGMWFLTARPDQPDSRKASSVAISDDRPSRSRKACYPGGVCVTGDLLTYKVAAGQPLKSTLESDFYTGYSGVLHVIPEKDCTGRLTYHITSDGVTRAGPASTPYTKDDTKTLTVAGGNTTVLNIHAQLATQATSFHFIVEEELSEKCTVSITLKDLTLTK
ncbi:hypothetical protein ACWET9_45305 [Streptomyces sp. NPDC004059]